MIVPLWRRLRQLIQTGLALVMVAIASLPINSFAGATGPTQVMIELADAPAVVAHARAKASAGLDAAQAGREQKNRIEQAQQHLLAVLNAPELKITVLYRVQSAYNGIAVLVDASQIDKLKRLPGVKAVHRLPLMSPDNASSVPLIGAPVAWTNYGITGTNITIGIIDTGIDYLHTDFGGPGSGYDSNNTTIIGDTPGIFPGAKVAGGYDFAGDAYDAVTNPVPHPDPDPMDCEEHGSHVAGTAAGYGVNADGTTYTGPYDTGTPFNNLRIGPGVAPGAKLYGLRVFGCGDNTALVTEAIDWAVDPNHDGDPSDHLDVINMSLTSPYSGADDPVAVASDNAALSGVIVVASAGNNYDLAYAAGSPGTSTRTLTVASSVDSTEVVDGFRVNAPADIAGVYASLNSAFFNWAASSPITRTLVYPGNNQTGCGPFTGADAALLSDQIVLLDWIPVGQTALPCDGDTRVINANAAGAQGIILAGNQPYIDRHIGGNNKMRATSTTGPIGDRLKSRLTPGGASNVEVTLTNEYAKSVKNVVTGRNDTLSVFSSRGPRSGDSSLKPDITAPGDTIFSVAGGTGTQGKTLSGTSMAAPHIAGVMGLLRQQNPSWTVEELKSLVMTSAVHDLWTGLNQSGTLYSPARVGAGRVDVANAISSTVIAYNADVPGAVSISFGAIEVLNTMALTRTVRVSNKGAVPVTYAISYNGYADIPGVNYAFPDGNSITVPGNSSVTFRVQLTADPSLMKNTRDPAVAGTQNGSPRQWLSEKSGLITLTPVAGLPLRLPVYVAARPASAMGTTQNHLTFYGAATQASLTLTGQGVNTGNSFPNDLVSQVTALELQGSSPISLTAPPGGRDADLQYIGITTDSKARVAANQPLTSSVVYFGISTYGNWSTPATQVEFDIYIDTNRDGVDDFELFNTRNLNTDIFVTHLVNLASGASTSEGNVNVFDSNRNTAIFNSNVMILPVNVSTLNLGVGTRFNYRVEAFDTTFGLIDQAGPFTYDYANPGLDFTGGVAGVPMYNDLPGGTIPVAFDPTAYNANNSQGILLLHHFNLTDHRAQVVPLITNPNAVTLSSFAATAAWPGVTIAWQTASEVGTLGFNVWRTEEPERSDARTTEGTTERRAKLVEGSILSSSLAPSVVYGLSSAGNGEWQQVNPALIPAQAGGSMDGARYTYRDLIASLGQIYAYRLEMVGSDGRSTWSNPVTIDMPKFRLYMPLSTDSQLHGLPCVITYNENLREQQKR